MIITKNTPHHVKLTTFAAMMGCTVEAIHQHLSKNSKQLRGMADRADKTGKLVNGYTGDQLRQMADRAETL